MQYSFGIDRWPFSDNLWRTIPPSFIGTFIHSIEHWYGYIPLSPCFEAIRILLLQWLCSCRCRSWDFHRPLNANLGPFNELGARRCIPDQQNVESSSTIFQRNWDAGFAKKSSFYCLIGYSAHMMQQNDAWSIGVGKNHNRNTVVGSIIHDSNEDILPGYVCHNHAFMQVSINMKPSNWHCSRRNGSL
jgi:hypothetical protein